MSGCSGFPKHTLSTDLGSPSSNAALNAVSPSKKKHENGLFSQNESDSEEAKAPEAIEEAVETNDDSNVSEKFKLQHYLDAWQEHERKHASRPSHAEKIEQLPVIGTPQ